MTIGRLDNREHAIHSLRDQCFLIVENIDFGFQHNKHVWDLKYHEKDYTIYMFKNYIIYFEDESIYFRYLRMTFHHAIVHLNALGSYSSISSRLIDRI